MATPVEGAIGSMAGRKVCEGEQWFRQMTGASWIMTGTMKAQQRAQASPEFPGSREQALVRESRKGLMPGRPGSTERRPTTPSTWQVLTEYFE